MPFRGMLIALLMLPFAGLPAGAQEVATDVRGAAGPSPSEREAITFRRLQAELMVAALACRDARHRAHYNSFIIRFRPVLKDNVQLLKAYFQHRYGPTAARELDAFMTRLANEASLASMEDADFCANALARFKAMNHTDSDQTAGMIVEEADLVIGR